jgi:aminomethyltransferase
MLDFSAPLNTTALHALHLELGAKMVAFSGYHMPVNYPSGILAEHRQCRQSAALFDVSHMGQLSLKGPDTAAALESLMPIDVMSMTVGKQRYGFFTQANGGILDDFMLTRREDDFLLIVNAACKKADTEHLLTQIGHRCTIASLPNQALLALQGPLAAVALQRLIPQVNQLGFMTGDTFRLADATCFITRSGYTGEDGFEISVPVDQANAVARALLDLPEVAPCGLGARDTLRLEAGLCLYGHDITPNTTPIEAGLAWAIQKVRRLGGARHGHYPGVEVLDTQMTRGVSHQRVGLLGLERVPVREGAALVDAHGQILGHVTSGTLSPHLSQPIAMAYLASNHAQPHHEVFARVRGKNYPMRVNSMPFVAHRYHRIF